LSGWFLLRKYNFINEILIKIVQKDK